MNCLVFFFNFGCSSCVVVRVQRVVVFAVESGSKAVWNFSENSSVLEEVGFPKQAPASSGF